MSLLEIESLLDAVKQFSDKDAEHWARYTTKWYRFRQHPYLHGVMISRRQARTRSVELFEGVLETRMSLGRLASARDEGASDSSEAQSGWWRWLDRLKDELREEKALIRPDYDGLRRPGTEQKQLEIWRTNRELRAKQSMAAVKLVLNFKAEAYAARRILVNDSWARLTDPAFPKEVLILVVEAAVRCQAPFLSIELSSDSLESMANHIFARWQEIMDHKTWGLLQQMTVRALLQHSIVRTTTGFTMANTLRFSPVIEGRERFIRFLALDLKIMPKHGTQHFQLTKSSQAMQSTKLLMPNLETCIIAYDFLHIEYDDVDLFFDDMPDVIEAILTISNVKNVDHVTTLGTTILESLAAFREHGPGRRKFVRFCHSDCDAIDFHHGPLVRIDGDVQVSDGEASTEDSAGEEDTAIKVAKRIFEKAYWHDPQWRGSS